MKVENWKLSRLKPYKGNPRHNVDAIRPVARSISEFGFRQPIVVDPKGVIIVGHTRYLAAKQLKLKTVPVHVAKGLTPKQIRAYRIADNRTADASGWDMELLPVELGALSKGGFDVTLTGFSKKQAAKLLAKVEPAIATVESSSSAAPLDQAVRCPKCGHTFEP